MPATRRTWRGRAASSPRSTEPRARRLSRRALRSCRPGPAIRATQKKPGGEVGRRGPTLPPGKESASPVPPPVHEGEGFLTIRAVQWNGVAMKLSGDNMHLAEASAHHSLVRPVPVLATQPWSGAAWFGAVHLRQRGRAHVRALDRVFAGPLPAAAAGTSLEGTGHVGGDPAAVEVARLGHDTFVIDPGLVDPSWVEGDEASDGLVAGQRPGIRPGCIDPIWTPALMRK